MRRLVQKLYRRPWPWRWLARLERWVLRGIVDVPVPDSELDVTRDDPRDLCGWVYQSPPCGYQGPIEDCDKTLADCAAHGNAGRFGGFPAPGVPTQLVTQFQQTIEVETRGRVLPGEAVFLNDDGTVSAGSIDRGAFVGFRGHDDGGRIATVHMGGW